MDLELAGKRALVTGEPGIGRAIARQLALEGADVELAVRDAVQLEQAAVGTQAGSWSLGRQRHPQFP